jgi:hypothetical protein
MKVAREALKAIAKLRHEGGCEAATAAMGFGEGAEEGVVVSRLQRRVGFERRLDATRPKLGAEAVKRDAEAGDDILEAGDELRIGACGIGRPAAIVGRPGDGAFPMFLAKAFRTLGEDGEFAFEGGFGGEAHRVGAGDLAL